MLLEDNAENPHKVREDESCPKSPVMMYFEISQQQYEYSLV